ncbi:MAG: hypothetical protein IJT73_07735 [Selenomonadaceae bacterium]|nr:hypothetical protein [Selenomonadaceae bacterium]
MENQILVFEHEKFGKVRCYIDENGTAFFNVEDIARGLGFTQTKNGVEYIRYETINKFLNQFGYNSFSQLVGKDDFIPENMVYRLAMKAKNETAENFQAWLADDVVPAIRKTGSYSLPNAETLPKVETEVAVQNSVEMKLIVAPALKDVEIAVEIVERLYGVKRGIALVHCKNSVEKNHHVDLSDFDKLLPPAEHEIGYLTPSQLAKIAGLKSAQEVNKKLLELGFQKKDGHGGYILTEKGKDCGEAIPYERNGHSGYQLRWISEVADFIEK